MGDRCSKTRSRGEGPKVVSYSRVGRGEPLIMPTFHALRSHRIKIAQRNRSEIVGSLHR